MAFILLMLGLEGVTGVAGIQLGLGIFLIIIGSLCFYAAVFWENAKKALSADAQDAIGRFAQSRITWVAVFFLAFQTIIFSKFVEQHRWPFSYPTDPAIYAEKSKLENALTQTKSVVAQEKELADKVAFRKAFTRCKRARCKGGVSLSARSYAQSAIIDYILA
jgi:hypothetical protein